MHKTFIKTFGYVMVWCTQSHVNTPDTLKLLRSLFRYLMFILATLPPPYTKPIELGVFKTVTLRRRTP